MGNTQQNLQEAFAGESQANRKYLAFSAKAEKEGYPQLARLFRATAEAETVHALKHLDAMGGIKTTKENLEAAIGGEHYEFTAMYPDFIKQAEAENNKAAHNSFAFANEVEKVHHGLYQKALEAVKAGQKMKEEPYYVCQICGYTAEGEAPDKCPVCGALKKVFKKVE
jgi:rubrerythrin